MNIFLLFTFIYLLSALADNACAMANKTLSDYESHRIEARSIVFTSSAGQQLRITPYGGYMIRVQAVRQGEKYFPDDHYEMVESHKWNGSFRISSHRDFFLLTTRAHDGAAIRVNKKPLRIAFISKGSRNSLLQDSDGIYWEGNRIGAAFARNACERFTGLGHGYFARAKSIELTGEIVQRNYGSTHGEQAPLIVPFYLSTSGYGVFLNSTFPNSFNFGKDGVYDFSIEGEGRMDYFFILGPEFSRIIDRYTQLTGRPRLPPLAMFGLALSDKGHDHTTATPSDENWWKRKVIEHRNAGFPLDHIVNDNRWRAGGGKRCESFFEWDTIRFPNPVEYAQWVKANGLVMTMDFNRCIAQWSDGWKPEFNIPKTDSIDFGNSAPDFTRAEVRDWLWNLFWRKSLNPELKYPGDALWIDEFDEMGNVPMNIILANGRSWGEMKNYWFFLIAKALVRDGWDRNFGSSKRPFVWIRGMTAGAQRYATLWSGDIKPTYDDMKTQIRGMQLAGLAGFPFWGHDAGGFHDWERGKGPDGTMYRQWSMAFGSFSPFWKPHGMGQSRWPLDRSADAQTTAKTYGELRYKLMPFTYTYAHESFTTGMPIARAMILEHQNDSLAWKHDLQFLWGRELLVAPNCSDGGSVSVWLPNGTWYDFWDDSKLNGNQVLSYDAPTRKLPLFVKAGSIIPMAPPSLSTAFMRRDSLIVHVYVGNDGAFTLYEDDGTTEEYKVNKSFRTTLMKFSESEMRLTIAAAVGSYNNTPMERAYRVEFHGLTRPLCMKLNGTQLRFLKSESDLVEAEDGVVWNKIKRQLSVFIRHTSVGKQLILESIKNCATETE